MKKCEGRGVSVKNRILSIIIVLLMIQISSPVFAATPASIQIDTHASEVSADQAIKITAVVKDSSGNAINEPIYWSASSGSIDSDGLFTPGMAGQTNITATSGNVNSTTTINVVTGWPVDIQSGFINTEVSVDDEVQLNATLVDRAGNPVSGDLTWRCQNGEINYDNNTWKPDRIGNATMRIIHLELEHQVVFNVVPGSPKTLDLPFGLTVQSGTTVHIQPTAMDSMGNEVGISKAGILSWTAENGSISPSGLFFGNAPGIWNITVNSSSGAFGSGVIRVLPAQATGLDIEIDVEQARTGSPIVISAVRTDVLGNSGEVVLPLSNWTVPTGSLSMEGDSVIWTPSQIGDWTIGVADQGFSATMDVNVIQGLIVGIEVLLSEDELRSGDSIVASVSAYDAAGNSVECEKGELVCATPFPSMPIYFWKDYNGGKYHDAYFAKFPGVWSHGDFIEITERGGVIVYGRSDTVLNPGGVRIGTAEIYRPVEEMSEIVDSLVVAQSWGNDVRIVLFVVLKKGTVLDDELISKIKATIRSDATTRHVPSRILEIQEVPRTISGKKVEKAVLQTIRGESVENISALVNPESLSIFADLREELKK